MAVDSEQASVIGVLARAHHDAVATAVRDSLRLRALLREFFPAALAAFPTLHTFTATTVLAVAPTPAAAAQLSEHQLRELMRAVRHNTPRGAPAQLRQIFTAPQPGGRTAAAPRAGVAARCTAVG